MLVFYTSANAIRELQSNACMYMNLIRLMKIYIRESNKHALQIREIHKYPSRKNTESIVDKRNL